MFECAGCGDDEGLRAEHLGRGRVQHGRSPPAHRLAEDDVPRRRRRLASARAQSAAQPRRRHGQQRSGPIAGLRRVQSVQTAAAGLLRQNPQPHRHGRRRRRKPLRRRLQPHPQNHSAGPRLHRPSITIRTGTIHLNQSIIINLMELSLRSGVAFVLPGRFAHRRIALPVRLRAQADPTRYRRRPAAQELRRHSSHRQELRSRRRKRRAVSSLRSAHVRRRQSRPGSPSRFP